MKQKKHGITENVLNETNSTSNSSIEPVDKQREGILITGGAGFVGSHIAEALLNLGKKIIVFDIFNQETTNSTEKHGNITILENTLKLVNSKLEDQDLKAELYVIKGDIRDRHLLESIISNNSYNITSVVHTAGMVDDRRSVSYPNVYFEVNVIGTATLLDVLGKSGKIKRVVQASTRSVFGEVLNNDIILNEMSPRRPVNPYGVSKVASDAAAHCYSHMYKMQVFLVRITSCYGHRGRPDMIMRILMENIKLEKEIKKYGTGNATRTWLYIDDLVDCFIRALFYGYESYNTEQVNLDKKQELSLYEEFNTGSKEGAVTLNYLIETAEKVIGKKAKILHIPDVPKGDANLIGTLDYSKAKQILGWEPKFNIERGMNALNKWYDEELKL